MQRNAPLLLEPLACVRGCTLAAAAGGGGGLRVDAAWVVCVGCRVGYCRFTAPPAFLAAFEPELPIIRMI